MTETDTTQDLEALIKEAKSKWDYEKARYAELESETEPDDEELKLQETNVVAANAAYKYLLEEKHRLYQQELADLQNKKFTYRQQQQQQQQQHQHTGAPSPPPSAHGQSVPPSPNTAPGSMGGTTYTPPGGTGGPSTATPGSTGTGNTATPGSSGTGNPVPPTIPYLHPADQMSLASLVKSAPKYYHQDVSWEVFMDQFKALCNLYPIQSDIHVKNVLYTSLKGEAMKMASPQYNPINHTQETFDQYAAMLRELFEPASESEQSKLAFEARQQVHGEHPSYYYQDKVALYKRAYKDGQRDYTHLYNKVISGMINQEMRNYLRLKMPSPLSDTNQFRNEIMFIATVVRRKYMDGEISESEAIGAEAFTSLNSYTTKEKEATLGKQVNVVASTYEQGKKSKMLQCYHCKSTEHFIAQCPRKASGLPAVQAMGGNQNSLGFRPTAQKRVNFNIRGGFSPANKGGTRRPPNQRYNSKRVYQQQGRNGRVMFVFENDAGELECTDVETEEDNLESGEDQVEQTTEGVNQIQLDESEGDTESDYVAHYVPGTFLGQ